MTSKDPIGRFFRRAPKCAATTLFVSAMFAFCGQTQAAIATSTFDAGAGDFDGWTALACINPGLCAISNTTLTPGGAKFMHFESGGENAGYIQTVDPDSDNAARLVAPAKFTDNLAVGRGLSLHVLVTAPNGGVFDSPVAPLIAIEGDGLTLVFGVPTPVDLNEWLRYFVPLTPDNVGWSAVINSDPTNAGLPSDPFDAGPGEFSRVLGDANKRLTVIGEWINDGSFQTDTGGLDSVNLVPIPAALPLLLSALAGIGFTARRRRT